jgi:hypothetical protein
MNVENIIGFLEDEDFPFEEWMLYLETLIEEKVNSARAVLNEIACNHTNDSWRFNAISLLIEHQMLSEDIHATILEKETDGDILQLLND